jgi:hypothetical protein
MYHPLTDLPTRVVPDSNVLLDAAFVAGGSARRSIDLLGASGYSILIEEMAQREAVRILDKLAIPRLWENPENPLPTAVEAILLHA